MRMILLSVLLTSCAHISTTVPHGCKQPLRHGDGWTQADEQQVALSQKRCGEKFGPGSCVKEIGKLGERRYVVICTRSSDL